MSTLTWITEKELEWEKKTKETKFTGRKTFKFYSGSEKMRSASGHMHQGENEQQGKKANGNTYDISSIKRVTWGSIWKFHIIVVQSNSEEMFQKVCSTCKVVFLLIRPIVFFFCFRHCYRLALHDFIFCLSKLQVYYKSFAFSPG